MEQTPTAGESLRLGLFLRRHRDALLAEWAYRIAARRPGDESASTLRDDGLPLLDRLAEIVSERSFVHGGKPFETLVEGLAIERFDAGLDLAATVGEYAIFREVVIERYRLTAAERTDVEDLVVFHRALDEAIRVTAERFSRERERTLAALDRVSNAAFESERTEAFVRKVLAVLLESAETADFASVFLAEGERLVTRIAVGMEEEVAGGFSVRVGEGFAGLVAAERRPLESHNAATDPVVRSNYLRRRGVRALYGIPLIEGDQLLGVAEIGSSSAFEFSRQDKLLFRALTGRVAAVLAQALLRERKRRERARAEEALARVDALLEAVPAGIAFLDPQLRYLHLNERLARINGRSARDHLGRRIDEVLPDRLRRSFEPALRRVLETGEQVHEIPVQLETDGELRDLEVDFFPIATPDGRLIGVGGMATDVTSRMRASEERERLLRELDRQKRTLDGVLAQLPVGVAIAVPPRGELVMGNRAFERIWMHPFIRAKQITDYAAYRGFHEDGRPVRPEEWPIARALAGEEIDGMELEIQRGDGTRATVLFSAAPIRDAEGSLLAAVVTALDITERKATVVELERAAQFRESFLGIVSHDLRNPVSAIALSADLLLASGRLEERDRRTVERIARSTDRMARMIRDLLDFTRGRLGGGIPLQPSRIDLERVCRTVVDEIESSRPGRAVTLELEGGLVGEWDGDRLSQAIANLATNAVDYSPAHEPVRLRARGRGERVEIEVVNGGDPIPDTLLPRLFEPFSRGEGGALRTGRSGLGLGLYIVRLIAEAHGGRVAVRSSREEGTVFTLALPRRVAHP